MRILTYELSVKPKERNEKEKEKYKRNICNDREWPEIRPKKKQKHWESLDSNEKYP